MDIGIHIGNVYLPSCIGIPSSNLTQDVHSLEILKSYLPDDFTPGWITLKTLKTEKGYVYSSKMRISHTRGYDDLLPDSIMMRGENEWITPSIAAQLSKKIQELFPNSKIKLSIQPEPKFITEEGIAHFQKLLIDLKDEGAQIDLIEIPLKYMHKFHVRDLRLLERRQQIEAINSEKLLSLIEGEILKSAYLLITFRQALNALKMDIPVIFKLSMDNIMPDYLVAFLSSPSSNVFTWIHERLEEGQPWSARILRKLKGAEGFIIFDSEKFPVALPSRENPRVSFIQYSEDGYSLEGLSIAGKALVKDSLKYIYEAYYKLKLLGSKSIIIASGGVSSGFDMAVRLMFGASGVEICTAALQKNPSFYATILKEFNNYITSVGFKSINDVIGLVHQRSTMKDYNPPVKAEIVNCQGCYSCNVFYWHGAIKRRNNKIIEIDLQKCLGCTACYWLCPLKKIRIKPV
jgi:Pyruvate/2-oxoacid:ferredoxin oxidoreductase delta subunit